MKWHDFFPFLLSPAFNDVSTHSANNQPLHNSARFSPRNKLEYRNQNSAKVHAINEATNVMKTAPDARLGILGYFLKWERDTPDAVFLMQPTGEGGRSYTWKQAGLEARKMLWQIQQLNYVPGTKIGIWSANCAEWVICDLAIMMGGYVSVPLYANVNAQALSGILLHAECAMLLVGKLDLNSWENNKTAIPPTVKILAMPGYSFESIGPADEKGDEAKSGNMLFPSPEDLITIIYTSGTTGAPKGVMHTYRSTISAVHAARDLVKLEQCGNRFLSYLPLSHAAERGLVEFGAIYSGGTISFVASADQFSANIQEAQPTHFLGVPRIWQKFREGILEKISQRKIDVLLRIPWINRILKKRIRSSLGLLHAEVILSGAAPITTELLQWFHRLGIPIQEAYGLSEDFNVCSINPKENISIGTTGKLAPGQDVKILPDTHEIIQRADWIMKGYYKEPELTAAVIQNGYFHTGDMGEIVDGYLTITGRVKDIFKTAKGEYIAPFPIESYFLSLVEVDQACVMGSRYPQPFIVIVLSKAGEETDKSILENKLKNTLVLSNEDSMGYQRLKKVIIASQPWTIENGLLTLTMKMKRNLIAKQYEERMESLYNAEDVVSWEKHIEINGK